MIRNLKEESPLDLAAQYGRDEVVQLLMTKHPSLAFHVHQKHSPLHLASRFGHVAVVQRLLNTGFEIGLKVSIPVLSLHISSVMVIILPSA